MRRYFSKYVYIVCVDYPAIRGARHLRYQLLHGPFGVTQRRRCFIALDFALLHSMSMSPPLTALDWYPGANGSQCGMKFWLETLSSDQE